MSFRIHVSFHVERRGLPTLTALRGWGEAALRAARRRQGELSIVLVDADEGRAMNRQYRGRDYATNVLSFPAELPPGLRSPLLGDLVVCAPVVAREAAEQHKTVADHCAHMVVHGTLHLVGYDHVEDADAERMEALETRILARLGIDDPYAERPPEPSLPAPKPRRK
jgi:probable rRNA maturation factor